MEVKEYLNRLDKMDIDSEKVEEIQKIYNTKLPESVKKIISGVAETIFLNNDYRVLSIEEIKDAEKDLYVAFKIKGIVPIMDCGENDFIVYHFKENYWSKFNIIDEVEFGKKETLREVLL